MLTTSLRSAVRASAVSLPSVNPTAGAAIAVPKLLETASNGLHQRRYSSSKPPVPPNDGSRPIDTSSQAPAKGVSPTGQKRDGKTAKRRAKESRRNGSGKSSQSSAFLNLPSVPSTQHLQPQDMHVASFFSLHRPMSVTTTVPPTTSPDAFNAIFDSKASRKSTDDMIDTLSSMVQTMEIASQGPQDDVRQPNNHAQIDIIHLDRPATQDLQAPVEELVRRLRPFHPPPPPVPMDEAIAAKAEETVRNDEPTSQQTYSTVLTIRESTHSDGHKTYVAHVSPFVRQDNNTMEAPSATETETSVDEPRRSGQTYMERTRDTRTMYAISVRRQRRLKMKKHKRKKWLRKTRHLRRKLDKA